MSADRKIAIFDTTLRDGQQCPGAGMSLADNLRYADLVAQLKVDVVEAGFPSASNLDFEIVKNIAEYYASLESSPIVAGLCQLRDEQIDRTIEALAPALSAKRARLHTYVPVDPALMVASLGQKADKGQIRENVYNFVKRAVDAGLEVEFSPEGYSRCGENFDFVTDLIRAAIEGGAYVINCPDTIGGASRLQGDQYFVELLNRHAAIIAEEYPGRSVCWSAHCHNDFGLAVSNSINAAFDGPCSQIEGCFNGVGERAGNAALESVIMILAEFGESADRDNPYRTGIDVSKLQEVCDFVSQKMLPCQPHWPVSGGNASKHSAGGHTNAILKNPLAYQPFDPRVIGKEISFLFGPLSGGNHAKSIIEDAGYRCDDDEKAEIAQFIKDLYSDRRKGITDEELLLGYFAYRNPIDVKRFDYSRSSNQSGVDLEGKFFDLVGGVSERHEGPDSALAALKQAVDKKWPVSIQSHKSESAGAGVNAVSVSTILITDKNGKVFEGIDKDQDIEISAMKALIAAVNQSFVEENFKNR